ncbi:hypothetical protein [Mycoplasma phocoenae]|uniref:Uncharacterized protein n=1 Tax=Mycoplasma phocoenae TaxID=754517 RepID=A0A858U6H9_9MOLU|nr:hypothetical protein [Mycoplasma phocoenae]QJG66833.1 hypothetical protein HGG69_00600 [Mycoplasma phocoenae]
MLKFYPYNVSTEYNGILLINCNNFHKLMKESFIYESINNNPALFVDNTEIYLNDLCIFTEQTRIADMYELSSKNWLFQALINHENSSREKLINTFALDIIKDEINKQLGDNLLEDLYDTKKLLKHFLKQIIIYFSIKTHL